MPRRLTALTVVEGLDRFVGNVAHRAEDTGVVVRHVEPAERRDGPFHHRGRLTLLRRRHS